MAHALLRLLWGPAVLLVAGAVTLLVGTFSFALGLLVGEPVLRWVGYPVAALMTGLAAGLAAAWTANLLAPDRSRTRLWRVLAWTEGAALVAVALFLVLLSGALGMSSLATLLLPVAILVPLTAAYVTLRSRRPQDSLRRDAIASALLLLLLPMGFYGVIGVACLFGVCGA